MRIDGPGSAGKPSSIKSKEKVKGSGFSEMLGGTEKSGGSVPLAGAGSIYSLYMVQEVEEDSSERKRRRYVEQGFDALEYLNSLRMGLLSGDIPVDNLKELEGVIESWRERTDDPRLNEILDDIELRARVELAKAGII